MLTSLKSALVSGILMAILAIAMYIIAVGDVFSIDARVLINTGVMALLTSVVSLIKSILTTPSGKVAGIQVR